MIAQLLPTASEEGQKLSDVNSSASVPALGVTETFMIDTAPAPVFFRVTFLKSKLN